ncbi:MAG: hypothetical protein QOG10_4780 [Kribbellaceae bacterium]|nr:hypothetical protein [Kribbellaceae bacterium]
MRAHPRSGRLRHPTRLRTDEGSALIVTLMVLAVVTALTTTVAAVTINNLGSSVKAQQAGSALNAADAGVAQAMTYLRNSGVGGINKCSPTCTTAIPWGSQSVPATATVAGIAGQVYAAWIEPIAKFPANDPGLYRIHSTGTAKGSASRAVTADIQTTKTTVPLGIVATRVDGAGGVTLTNESIFSSGCVSSRKKVTLTGFDAAYGGIPAGVHTSDLITEAQVCGKKAGIHGSSACDTAYKFDQDSDGGSLLGTGCAATQTGYPTYYAPKDLNGDGSLDVDGSFVRDDASLQKLFGFTNPALSPSQLENLRSIAQSQGNYWTSSSGWTSPDERQAVMYFDLTKGTDLGGEVDLDKIIGFGRDPGLLASNAACDDRSLIIIIEGGNARLNSSRQLVASLFLTATAPNGRINKVNGGSTFVGSMWADTINFAGSADLSLDECFVNNLAPGLLGLTQTSYREVDR